MILVDSTMVESAHRDEIGELNFGLEQLAKRRLAVIDIIEEPYRRSKIAWKVAMLSNAVTHRFISLAEGAALSWNDSIFLSAVLNGRAMVETAAFFWEFSKAFEKHAAASEFAAVDGLVTKALFGTRDEQLLEDNPELKARQILNSIDAIDKHLLPGYRSHYDGLSEFCHPNSFGHRGMFSTIDHKSGIATFQSKGGDGFIHAMKCALGTSAVLKLSLDSVEGRLLAFAHAHHAASPSPLVDGERD
ncbi:hypothetical protein [Bradyrhizobium sp. Leo170]|uniref:hypothetical protein n=1 Tax=Bradyrhizobium sp. Leo170 TaxID=1571199 RepID=UPI00102E9953|nr:hypothetical protein [Bradyrhizobium sp. Leo170]TAI60321.1 hypothetical protein CWO89_41330 [Bradyrhizobium sp. Leo170]